MKKRLFFLLIALFTMRMGFAQVTVSPRVEGTSAKDVTITKVELTSQYTIVHMKYASRKLNFQERFFQLLERETMSQSNIAIDPDSELQVNHKGGIYYYRFVKATGIPVRPENRVVQPGDEVSFVVYFERLEPGMEDFNLFECRTDQSWQCWNFYHIHVNNPASKQKKNLNAPAVAKAPEVKKTPPAPLTVLISGQVYDAVTKEPLEAKIALQKTGAKTDSIRTVGSTGVFRKNVAAGAYKLSAVVPGYETASASVTVKDTPIDKDFYLQPTNQPVAAVTPPPAPVEPVTPVVPPTKIEELKPEVGSKIELKNILFETGKAEVMTDSRQELEQVVEWMKKNPTVEIRLEGHTDAVGDPQKNMELSIERVVSVKRYLINKGIEPTRIETKGYGDTKPFTTSKNEKEKQKNRRVELIVVKK